MSKKTAIQIVDEMLRNEHDKRPDSTVPEDWAYRRALRNVIERLKKEPLSEAEQAAVRDFIDSLSVYGDWIVQSVESCTCAAPFPAGSPAEGMHEPGCGYEPIMQVKDLPRESDTLQALTAVGVRLEYALGEVRKALPPETLRPEPKNGYDEMIERIEADPEVTGKAERHRIKDLLFHAAYGNDPVSRKEAADAMRRYNERHGVFLRPVTLGEYFSGGGFKGLLDAMNKPEGEVTLEQAIREGIGYDLVPLSIRDHPEITKEFRTADDADGLVERISASLIKHGFVKE